MKKQSKNLKKQYEKPTVEMVELRPEERIAQASNTNCHACQGAQTCAPGGFPGGGQ